MDKPPNKPLNNKPQLVTRQQLFEKVIEAVRRLSPEEKAQARKHLDDCLFPKKSQNLTGPARTPIRSS
jgi:hypothetical protein